MVLIIFFVLFLHGLGWFNGLGEVLDGLGRFLRPAIGCKYSETRFSRMSEVICWILGAPGETFHQHIGDLGSLRGAPRGSRRPFWLRLVVKNRDEQLNR